MRDFGEGSQEKGPVTCVSPGCYRLGWTPLVAAFEDIEVFQGDVIEAEPTSEGTHRFVRVVERGRFEHSDFVVGPAFLESRYFDAFAAALEAAGGSWEVPVNGWLVTHVPTESPFDLDEQLFRERVRAYQAGIVDVLPDSD
jgi:hypothetical protein